MLVGQYVKKEEFTKALDNFSSKLDKMFDKWLTKPIRRRSLMARSTLTNIQNDLVSDAGAVLWSFVKGEQLEYPVLLNFLSDVYAGYTFEAVVVEADNFSGQSDRPISIKSGGVQTVISVRIPTYKGSWSYDQAYNRQEVVAHNGVFYTLTAGAERVNSSTPDVDSLWEVTSPATIYLQFPANLGAEWSVSPQVNSPVYGFFELRVTEVHSGAFNSTWKPVRGMIQILFSPTEIVPDT